MLLNDKATDKNVVDVRGMSCPMPIIKTSRALKAAASGEVFEVIADDEVFGNDIAAWCKKTGNMLENITVSSNEITATIVKG